MHADATLALIGRPNCGKTTLFNALTGERQWVGNWPGVTVEGVHGAFEHLGRCLQVVDLPGAYTLSGTRSLDEEVAAEFLAAGRARVVINVVDAATLERSLYLTAQVLESQGGAGGVPVIVALNRMDKAAADGVTVDIAALAAALGCPVVAMSVARGEGVENLKQAVALALSDGQPPPFPAYPEGLLALLGGGGARRRWAAIRAVEDGRDEGAHVDALALGAARHAFAAAASHRAVTRTQTSRRNVTDRLDAVLLHPALGVLGFLLAMYLMFLWTINLGGAFVDAFDGVAGALFETGLAAVVEGHGAPSWLVLLAEGAGRGARTMAAFIPLVAFLYAFLAFLEESGYMARAAVVMDRFMRRIGLPGKAFVPLVVGFGCNVPAVMAARTLDDIEDRKATIAMTPFISCGARLPVYALFAAVFFPDNAQDLVFALYLIGIAVAVFTGFVLKRTVFSGEAPPLLIELPPYHWPRLGPVVRRALDRVVSFVKDAGTVVVPVVMLLTVLNAVTLDGRVVRSGAEPQTVLAEAARLATPLLAPIGVAPDNWQATVGLFTGLFAKEAVVGTLAALYATAPGAAGEAPRSVSVLVAAALATIPANLGGLWQSLLDPLGLAKEVQAGAGRLDAGAARALEKGFDGTAGAFAYLVFVLLYAPCVATVAAIRREAGGRWTLFVLGWTTVMGFTGATLAYQGAPLPRHPGASLAWIAGALAVVAVAVVILRRHGRIRIAAGRASSCGGCRGCAQSR
ncbi:MAG: ferrous iron transport protein B [Magnetospirillum sp.]|nr:ferrous iron transport protein B [Magnetospirillum sp.]